MGQSDQQSVTTLLHAARDGDPSAFDQLYERLYKELHNLARLVRMGNAAETLNTTALVHEAYMKLIPSREHNWQDRTHFLRVAARAMRQVIVKAARRKKAYKRGAGNMNITFKDELFENDTITPEDILSLDDLLSRLEEFDARQAKVVEYRFFAGMNVEETASLLDVSTATVKRDWRIARAWLIKELGHQPP